MKPSLTKKEMVICHEIYNNLLKQISIQVNDENNYFVDKTTNERYVYFERTVNLLKCQIIIQCYVYILGDYKTFGKMWNNSRLNNEADYDEKKIIIRTAYDEINHKLYDNNLFNNLLISGKKTHEF